MKVIEEKAQYSESRIDDLIHRVAKSGELSESKEPPPLCIYTTGSYGRLEASEHSDIDLFFLYDGAKPKKVSRISQTLVASDVIRACREMGFPEFSGDGEYVEMHDIQKIHHEIGSRNDDYHNYFTARMLLLLESKCIYNDALYNDILIGTVNKYYKDFNEHESNFKPVFLVNDVIRYWRTVCLNYEHNRNRKSDAVGIPEADMQIKRNKAHVKNLKLKFSRKLTCFSFLLSVLYSQEILDSVAVLEVIKMTPLARVSRLAGTQKVKEEIRKLVSLYFWFLEVTQKDEGVVLDWISDETNRNKALGKSREFAKSLFNLMMHSPSEETLMYFIV